MTEPARPPETLGARLQNLRTFAGVSRRRLSQIAGIAPALVGMIERGKVASPQAGTLVRIARVLGCSIDWLATGTGRAPSRARVMAAVATATAANEAAANPLPPPAA
ncbi:helix-turn-helix domain-containing protein [Sorangium sp. So ce834]|uniref:helix-turn-helix domain-containing protein n=1 Tax=Sorangium sp. So ce834 TaxID=3133321 RepID=UPI003F5E1806